jgi:hypothetical protein
MLQAWMHSITFEYNRGRKISGLAAAAAGRARELCNGSVHCTYSTPVYVGSHYHLAQRWDNISVPGLLGPIRLERTIEKQHT